MTERVAWLTIGLLCSAVVWFCGKHFYIGAWKAFVNHNANMDTLIALGTGTAMTTGLINLGLTLEIKARGCQFKPPWTGSRQVERL